jgi:hypothetical protein
MSGRQLHLFRARNQRGVAAPPPLEFELHCAVADTLRRWGTPGWIFSHIPLGEERTTAAGARLKRMGTAPGWADLIMLAPRGHPIQRPHFLELKRRGGKLTEHQAGFALWCKLNDCPHEVADSYEAAVKTLRAWGALMHRVKVQ